MSERDKARLERKLDTISGGLPRPLAAFVRWLKSPWSRFVRLPLGVLLVFFGLLGFLPVLGFWMVPLGLVILALDIPRLRRPTLKAIYWIEKRWRSWRRRKS